MAIKIPEAWHPKICAALRKLRVNRINAKSKLDDAITRRKELEAEIQEVGKQKTDARLELDHELVTSLQEIKYQRARRTALADQIEKVIDQADQGTFDFVTDDTKTDFRRGELFRKPAKPEPEDEDGDDDEDGEGEDDKKSKGPKQPKAPGWHAHALEKLENIPAGVRQQLLKNKMNTLGILVNKLGIPTNDRLAFSKACEVECGIGNAGAVELGNALTVYIESHP